MTIKRDPYAEHMLSLDLESAKNGSAKLDRTIAGIFGRDRAERWTQDFEVAAKLFHEEFGRGQKDFDIGVNDWTRECFMNGCNGISWNISEPVSDAYYSGWGETDALALCAAMVRAKRQEARP